MEALQIFSYNEAPVTFKNENGVVFISATEMAQQFGKTPKDYLRTKSSQELLDALSNRLKCPLVDLVQVAKGGIGGGTWMQEDIALDFAQWLSIDFKLWCNDRIKELLRHGVTSTENMMEQMLTNPDAMITALTALKAEREEKQRLLNQNALQQRELLTIAPKAEYFDTVMQSTETYATTRIAQELGLSAIALNKKLHEMRVQRKVDKQWVLYAQYLNGNYAKSHTVPYLKSNGETGTNTQTVWTEKGRQFIHSLFKN